MTEERAVRVCVVDDEPIACRRIQRLLKEDPEVEIVRTCLDGEQAVEAIQSLQPDLIFLDVQMPGMDGFEVLSSLEPATRLPYVIFVPAYNHYAIRAFEVQALDYLLKPFDKKRFGEALKRAKTRLRKHEESVDRAQLASLIKELAAPPPSVDRIMVKSGGKVFFLKTDDIDWIEAQGKYAAIHAGRECHLVREGMNNLETALDPGRFLRIHKSTIVNIDRIEHLQPLFHGDYRVFLRNGTVLTVSRRYRQKMDAIYGKPL